MALLQLMQDAVTDLTDYEEDIDKDTLIANIGFDSLDFVDIQLRIKKAFQVSISPDDFINNEIDTFGKLEAFINTLRESANSEQITEQQA